MMRLALAVVLTFAAPAAAAAQVVGGGRSGGPAPPPPPATVAPTFTEGTGAISGLVVDSVNGSPIAEAVVYLTLGGRPAGAQPRQFTDARGRFAFASLPAGKAYALSVSKPGYLVGGYSNIPLPGAHGGLIDLDEGEWHSTVRLTLSRTGAISSGVVDEAGEPVVGVRVTVLRQILSLVLQPGSVVTGRVHFDASTEAPPNDLTSLRVSVSSPSGQYSSSMGDTLITNTFIGGPTVSVRPDGTFEVKAIGPGVVALSCFMPTAVSAKWWVRSAISGGRDLLDAPFDIAATGDFRDVVITLSDRRPELSGTLQTPAGQPAPEYYVIVFPADASQRIAGSRRIQAVRPTTAGRFVFPTLPPGDYVLAALLDVMPNEWNDLKFLEQVAQAGVRLRLGEGEKKVQDLRIAGGS